MGVKMHYLICAFVAISLGCGSPNPDFCCVTESQCLAAGVSGELRPCDLGQACNAENQCVAKECNTSVDCASPDNPRCENGICVGGCTIDDDCLGLPTTPYCDAATNTCVGCLVSDQCPANLEICDDSAHECRGCTSDQDCGDGVCVEASGRCVVAADVIYVTSNGTDGGTCPKTTPCRTIGFALGQVMESRQVIKILSGALDVGATLNLDRTVIIDGSGSTQVTFLANPGASVTGSVLIEGVSLRGPTLNTMLDVAAGGDLTMFGASFEDTFKVSTEGDLVLVRSRVRNVDFLECTMGNIAIRESRVEDSLVETSNCAVEISRSHLGPGPSSGNEMLIAGGGNMVIENNLFFEMGQSIILMSLTGAGLGSVFRFNTVVHANATDSQGSHINCSGIELTSNLIALSSAMPLGANCAVHDTLFDLVASPLPGGGTNHAADATRFFMDRAGGDYHLAPNSPAIGLGESGLVDTDFDGTPRPLNGPDVGAFEAP